MDIDQEIRQEIVDYAQSVEKEFGVRCLVVGNEYRIPIGNDKLSMLLLPSDGESREAFESKGMAAFSKHQKSMFDRIWSCYFGFIYNVNPWFSRFMGKREKFPLADMAMGSDLISEVIYGQDSMDMLQKKAEDFFGKGTIEFWKKEAARQREEKNKRLKEIQDEESAYLEERRKLLNKHELRELRTFVEALVKDPKSRAITFVVALDGSGRPIGKALEWYGLTQTVVYFDPRHLRKVDFRNPKETAWIRPALQKEFPELLKALSSHPQEVLFIDDQTGYGNTAKALSALIKFLSGKSKRSFNYATMTDYQVGNTPSWLRRREIQGLKPAPEKSFRAEDFPTRKSKQFYSKIRKEVLGWKKEV